MGSCNDDSSYKNEKYINSYPKAIFKEKCFDFLKQLEHCICKIERKDGSKGTGFFCIIPFPDKLNLLPVLITNNHVLNKDYISKGNIINFSLNNESESFKIIIDDSRLTYTSKEYDITIIEINKNDGLETDLFLDLDFDIFKNIEQLENSQIYLLHYPNGFKLKVSFGVIKKILPQDFSIQHLCHTEPGSSGGPIINSNNEKVIGIHKGSHPDYDYNVGTLLSGPIFDFIKSNKKSEFNNIAIKEIEDNSRMKENN